MTARLTSEKQFAVALYRPALSKIERCANLFLNLCSAAPNG